MVIKTADGGFAVRSRVELLDFLSGVSGRNGEVKEDVSLFVPVTLSVPANTPESSVPWTFSTFDLDRYDERVDPQGWELSQYKNNPVVQWAHRFDVPAIGRADDLLTDDKGLHGTIIFNEKEYDTFGWSIGERVKRGVLRAGSVGFRILEVELPSKQAQADGTVLIFRRQELLEFSICNVPANPFALREKSEERKKNKVELSSEREADFWGGMLGCRK
jgi:HK97 family phage prohead protease